MPNWSHTLARLRQWSYPAELRIHPGPESVWLEDLAAAAAALGRDGGDAVHARADVAPTTAAADPTAAGVDPRFVTDLCNELFRLKRNVDQLQADGSETPEVRKIGRAIGRLEDLLAQAGVDSRDLAGERFDDGRVDFEPLSEAEVDPSLAHATITRCERPRVVLLGKLVQRARGLVARPPASPEPVPNPEPVPDAAPHGEPPCPRNT